MAVLALAAVVISVPLESTKIPVPVETAPLKVTEIVWLSCAPTWKT